MNDWPFSAREMTIVHYMFIAGCGAEFERLKAARTPGAKRSYTIAATHRGAALDRAFDALHARGALKENAHGG